MENIQITGTILVKISMFSYLWVFFYFSTRLKHCRYFSIIKKKTRTGVSKRIKIKQRWHIWSAFLLAGQNPKLTDFKMSNKIHKMWRKRERCNCSCWLEPLKDNYFNVHWRGLACICIFLSYFTLAVVRQWNKTNATCT